MKWNPTSVVGLAFAAIAVVVAFLAAPEENTTAYRLGYAFGVPVFALAVTVLGRALQRRLGDAEGDFWTPGAVLALGTVAVLVALLALGARTPEDDDPVDDLESSAESCLAEQQKPVGSPAPGFAFEPLAPDDRGLAATIASELGIDPSLFDGRVVTRKGVEVGAVVLFPGLGAPGDYQAFLRGTTESQRDQGVDPLSVDLAGERAVVGVGSRFAQVAIRSGCYGAMVVTGDVESAQAIAAGVADSG